MAGAIRVAAVQMRAKVGDVAGNLAHAESLARQAFRGGVLDFTRIGIPVSKLGIILGFQTTRGQGGREGLAAQAWLETVKWQVLSARYVAREMKFHSVWSWDGPCGRRRRRRPIRRSRSPRACTSGRATPRSAMRRA